MISGITITYECVEGMWRLVICRRMRREDKMTMLYWKFVELIAVVEQTARRFRK